MNLLNGSLPTFAAPTNTSRKWHIADAVSTEVGIGGVICEYILLMQLNKRLSISHVHKMPIRLGVMKRATRCDI